MMEPILSVENVAKTYGNGFTALKPVNLAIRQGEIFALLGPNGAGKTTLISIICGLTNRSQGTVRVGGHDIGRDGPGPAPADSALPVHEIGLGHAIDAPFDPHPPRGIGAEPRERIAARSSMRVSRHALKAAVERSRMSSRCESSIRSKVSSLLPVLGFSIANMGPCIVADHNPRKLMERRTRL